MIQVSRKTIINASADAIWQVISSFDAACHYLDMVVDCTVTGEGIGALRTLTSVDGSTVIERLEALDKANHRLSYTLLTDTPFRNCLTTMTLRDLNPSHCELEWSATFEPDGLPASDATELMEPALAANCARLKEFMEG